MAFDKDDRDYIITTLIRIETHVIGMKPQVKANTRFRHITLGVVLFCTVVGLPLLGFYLQAK